MTLKKLICTAILFSCQTIAIIANPTPDNFMSTLAGTIKLRNLSLLGSHDSGTYGLDPCLGVAPDEAGNILFKIGNAPVIGPILDHTFIKNWSQTQTHSIADQLLDGVRYFDLRVTLDPQEKFRICHGLYGPLMDDILNQLNSFLNARPGEMVFLDFQHLFDQNGSIMSIAHQNLLISKIQQVLGNKLAPSTYGVDVTLAKMRQGKKQVIIFWDTGPFNFPNIVWSRNKFLSSPWYNLANWNALETALNQGISKQPTGQFFVNQAILSPDVTMVLTHIFSNLLNVEATTNASIIPWYAQKAAAGLVGNILMVDNEATIYQQAFQISMNYNSHL